MCEVQKQNFTSDLEDLRHTLLNANLAIQESLRKIEYTVAYMSEATKIFDRILEKVDDAKSKTI